MKRFLVVLFAGAAAVFASCNDEETGKENKWFYAPEAGVSGTTVEVSCRTKFGDGVLSSAQAGFAYAPIRSDDTGSFTETTDVTVDGQVMSCRLTGLDAETSYLIYAYVDMGSGGRMQSKPVVVKTGENPELPVEADNGDYHYAYHICPDFKVDGHEARNFTVCYSAEHHSPVWVAAPVHNCYVGSSGNRNYGPDPVIPSSIQPSGSKASMGSPYNRGHMLGNYERSRTSGMNKQVSYYTNIAAQHGSTFNTGDGAWNNLEDKIDDYWCADTLYVVVGAYYDKWTDSYGNSAPQRSTSFGNITTDVPTMFYTLCLRTKKGNTNKSVLNCAADELQCAAFVMSHAMGKGHDPQAGDMRSVKEIEELTGFTFFANVPNAPKDTYNASDWGL